MGSSWEQPAWHAGVQLQPVHAGVLSHECKGSSLLLFSILFPALHSAGCGRSLRSLQQVQQAAAQQARQAVWQRQRPAAQRQQRPAAGRWARATAASRASSRSSAAPPKQRSTMQPCSAAGAACHAPSSSPGGAAAAAAAAGCGPSRASLAMQTARACRWGPMWSSRSSIMGEVLGMHRYCRVTGFLGMSLKQAMAVAPRLLVFAGCAR